ncbi:MAG: hypothetical protein Q9190_005341 [Brigantiaea leucoxantha]
MHPGSTGGHDAGGGGGAGGRELEGGGTGKEVTGIGELSLFGEVGAGWGVVGGASQEVQMVDVLVLVIVETVVVVWIDVLVPVTSVFVTGQVVTVV